MRFAAGTMQLSNTNSAVFDALMPVLSMIFWPTEYPTMPASMRNVDIWMRPASSSPVLAYTRTTSAGVPSSSRHPLVIHIFLPFSTYVPSSCFTAVVDRPSTSVPASGSDIAIAPIHSPEHTFGRTRVFCSSFAL